jgi:hypothetical protein
MGHPIAQELPKNLPKNMSATINVAPRANQARIHAGRNSGCGLQADG